MSTGLIIVIVVVVVIVILGLLLTRLPKAREQARLQKRERELDERRDQVVDQHREEAASRERQAEVSEQRARVAAQEAQKERAESQLAQEKARLHERGLADHELIGDDERERFAGTSATEPLAGDAAAVPTTERSPRTDAVDQGSLVSPRDPGPDEGAVASGPDQGRDEGAVASGPEQGLDEGAYRRETVNPDGAELPPTPYEEGQVPPEGQAAANAPSRLEDLEAGRREEDR